MNMLFERRMPFCLSVVLAQLTVGVTVLGSGLTVQAQPDVIQLPKQTSNPAPQPGTVVTSAATLQPQPSTAKPAASVTDSQVAQIDINPGQATRGGSSYIAIGLNIGLDGETALGDGNFAVTSKIGFTNSLSVRPGVVIGDNTVFTIPITYDISLLSVDEFEEPVPVAPFVGAGVAISTGSDGDDDDNSNTNDDDDDGELSFLLTGGVDIPINEQFTATAAVNVAFFDETDIGLLLGIGYNFSGF